MIGTVFAGAVSGTTHCQAGGAVLWLWGTKGTLAHILRCKASQPRSVPEGRRQLWGCSRNPGAVAATPGP